jgi:methyltransferase (TIGR00027 family)
VGGAKRSRTAQGVAAERALLAELGVLDDPSARPMLEPAMGAIVEVARRLPRRTWARAVTLAGLAGRVRWFDAQVTHALDDGIEQVAVIGAGYDGRAWRMRRDGVRFFELDHAATQQDKIGRAPGPGPTYVEVDLRSESAADALVAAGLDRERPVLHVVEGVTMYLTEEVVRRQLGELAAAGATGSRLAVDFYPPSDAGTSVNRRQRRLQQVTRGGSGESFRLAVGPGQAVALVEEAGWRMIERTSARDASCSLVPRGSGLPVDAVNEHKTLIAARLDPA